MKQALHELLGEALDAIYRGICYGLTFSAFWVVAINSMKLTPKLLKAMGVW